HVEQGLPGAPSITGGAAPVLRHFAMIGGLDAPTKQQGSRHGARRRLAQQGGGVSREGTCRQRSATCSASPRAGAQLSQVRRGDGTPPGGPPPLAVQTGPFRFTQIAARGGLRRGLFQPCSRETVWRRPLPGSDRQWLLRDPPAPQFRG